MKKLPSLTTASILILSSIAVVVGPIILIVIEYKWQPFIYAGLTQIKAILNDSISEYFLFIGTTFISLLFLKKKHWILATLSFMVGLNWITFHAPTVSWLNKLGTDSFEEARNFSIVEAKFWLDTMSEEIKPNFKWEIFALYSSTAVFIILALRTFSRVIRLSNKKEFYLNLALASIFIITAVHQTFSKSLILFFKDGKINNNIKENFSGHVPSISISNKLNVVVYMGESVSTMNMGALWLHA